MIKDDTIAPTKLNMTDRYKQRFTDLDSVNFLKMFRYQHWDGPKKKWVPLQKHPKRRCVNVWPNHIPDRSDPAMYENWCRAKLQFHHLYKNLDDLRIVDGEHVDGSQAYEHCKMDCGPHEEDPLSKEEDLEEDEDEDEFEEPDETEGQRVRRDWQVYTVRGPRARPGHEEPLGNRDIDIDFDWHHLFTIIDDLRSREDYLKSEKAKLWTKIQM